MIQSAPLEAFLVSLAVVAVGEIGDKTQLLALLLAARFRQPPAIITGIFVAAALNHLLAALVGGWIRSLVDPHVLRWLLGLSFLAIAAWAIKPDRLDDKETPPTSRYGVFLITLVSFFLAEFGDKTQLATVGLAARFGTGWLNLALVVAGTTLGMLVADVPAVLLGGSAMVKIPFRAIRLLSAALLAAVGIAILAGFGG